MRERYLGIEIGGTKLQVVRGNSSGAIEERIRLAVDKREGAAGIKTQIERSIQTMLQAGKPSAVGVGFGGPVDAEEGTISLSFQVDGWSDFNFVSWLKRITGVPVFIDNDANVAALGEARHGAGKGIRNVFYMTIGSGVGGGLVQNDKIYHGALPGESEIGHICLDRNGTTLESQCSGWAVDENIRQVVSGKPDGILAGLVGDAVSGEARFLKSAIQAGDGDAKEILTETASHIGFALSHVVHLFHPDIIVIGGGLSLIGEPLRVLVESNLRPFLMKAFLPGPVVALSQLREDAVPVGALTLAGQKSRTIL